VVFIFDMSVVLTAYQSAVLLRFNLEFASIPEGLFTYKLPLILTAYLIGFFISKSFVGVIRHTSFKDAYSIFQATLIGLSIIFGAQIIVDLTGQFVVQLQIPKSIIVIHFLLCIFILISSRLMVKVLYSHFTGENVKKKRVLIYGAGTSGMITKHTLAHDTSNDFSIVGFIDDNKFKIGKKIEGIPVYSREKALNQSFIEKNEIAEVIISIQKEMSSQKRSAVVEECLQFNLRVKIVPPVDTWIHGQLSTNQIKSVRIEDLLDRKPIELDSTNVKRELKGKTILISGAAGSIGSEITRQVLHFGPHKVILVDQAESPMYNLEFEIKSKLPRLFKTIEWIIADVRDQKRMAEVFDNYQPQLVFHAAAYKHVPLMESNVYEAVGVNIFGTKTLADLALKHQVEKFVMVSTDKAVNPTNVMGATKRAAEIYTRCLSKQYGSKTQFITTRFGNVLGSNGSVIPLFRKQIEEGGPITLTHKEITRFFMTIPEACNLVLEAGSMGKGGEIFVFDMGRSVKIYDLAKKMIKLSGLTLGKDIEIKEVGLRPGEKLFEELLASKENTMPTHHPKIMIAKPTMFDWVSALALINRFYQQHGACTDMKLVSTLKEIVPEFLSQNSKYAELDLKGADNE
jgi:FlaA1/EpsC-like NDP-sugar epimerase